MSDMDIVLNRLASLEDRLSQQETREYAAGATNADTVDGIHAAASATANKLLALDASSKLPASITGDADTVDGVHAADINADKVDGYHASEIPASYIRSVFSPLREEFLHPDHTEDFLQIAIASGTSAAATGGANHPGCVNLRGTTSANSGRAYFTAINAFLLAGGEEFEIIFKTTDASSENRARFGWGAASDATAAPKGVYIRINGLTLDGVCKNASGTSTTSTSYTYSAETWYRATIIINSGATLVTFTLYSESGTQLWQQTLSTNIPTAAGDEVGVGAVWYQSSTSQRVCTVDWMTARISRSLTR